MATYKVIQDVEADDKLIWQLSFRQFIYALIAVFMIYISYLAFAKHIDFLLVITLPIVAFCGFLAYPFGKDQPTELWALAKLRFLVKPRQRVWTQTGTKELVTITVPKRVDVDLTDGLSQVEVKSRLQALANTLDSRGWAVKNVSSVYQNPLETASSERLISASALTQNTLEEDISDSDDVLDVTANPAAQQMDEMLTQNGTKHRQQLIESLNQIRQPAPAAVPPVSQPVPAPNDMSLSTNLKQLSNSQQAVLNNMRSLSTKTDQSNSATATTPAAPSPPPSQSPSLPPPSTKINDPVIMNLANRDDLNVTVIAHEVNKAKNPEKSNSNDEVLISLH